MIAQQDNGVINLCPRLTPPANFPLGKLNRLAAWGPSPWGLQGRGTRPLWMLHLASPEGPVPG